MADIDNDSSRCGWPENQIRANRSSSTNRDMSALLEQKLTLQFELSIFFSIDTLNSVESAHDEEVLGLIPVDRQTSFLVTCKYKIVRCQHTHKRN